MKTKPNFASNAATTNAARPSIRQERVAVLAQQINNRPEADPSVLAAAIERLVLTEILDTLADPGAPPDARLAASEAYFKWRQGDLARQRLALEQAKLAAAQQKEAENSAPDQSPEEAQAEITQTLDKLDRIIGISPRPRSVPDPISVPFSPPQELPSP